MFKDILVATDFSSVSKDALRMAIQFCKATGAKLHVVYVLPEMEGRVYEVLCRLAEKDMQRFFPSKLYQNNQKRILFSDSVADVILDYAKEYCCDMIVLGYKDRSSAGDLVFGSIIDALQRNCEIPVMLVTAGKSKIQPVRKIRSILVPYDFSVLSKKALRFAVKCSKALSADLHVVSVVDSRIPLYYVQLDRVVREMNLRLRRLKKPLLSAGRFKAVALAGIPVEEIRKYAMKNSIDLIVMSTHPARGLAKWFAANTASTILKKTKIPEVTISSTAAAV